MYYRTCWHMIRCPFLVWYRQSSSHTTAVYNPKAFFLHAASLGQAFAHCRRFSTAATRRCQDSVSVPVLGVMLSHPLPVIALVSYYLTNKLIGRRTFQMRRSFTPPTFRRRGLWSINPPFGGLFSTSGYVPYALLTRLPRV